MIEQIARNLAARAAENKHRPYQDLAWLCKNCLPCGVSESDGVLIHLAAINILKSQGIENAKRKPLSTLTPKDRQAMRRRAKEFVEIMERVLGKPVAVTNRPIKTAKDGTNEIQLAIKPNHYTTVYLLLTDGYLSEWHQLDEANRLFYARQAANQFKSQDSKIADNLETIKSRLECLL